MNIFVINLAKDAVRRESIKKQFESQNIDFEFSDGVLGSALTKEELNIFYNDKLAKRNQCRSLALAEIGCSLSHVNLYKYIIDHNVSHALILEDDVIIPDNFSSILKKIENNILFDKPNVYLLSPGEPKNNKGIQIDNKYSFYRYKSGYFTSSYIINNLAAQTLFKELYPINNVADCWGRLVKFKIANIYIIYPALIEQDQDTFGSSTTEDVNKILKTDLLDLSKYKLCRLVWRTIDEIVSLYRRIFHPYLDILKKL